MKSFIMTIPSYPHHRLNQFNLPSIIYIPLLFLFLLSSCCIKFTQSEYIMSTRRSIYENNNNNILSGKHQEDVVQYIIRNLSTNHGRDGDDGQPSWMNDEEATILDVFGQVAKDVLTNRLIPETNANCDWNWKHLRCEPYCHCSLQFQWGDYHLGRSCRNRTEISNYLGNGNTYQDNINHDDNDECNLPPNTTFVKVINTSGQLFQKIVHSSKTKIQGLNFIIKRKVHDVKDDMCTALMMKDDGYDYYHNFENGDDYNHDDNDEIHNSEVMEKPVRALKRMLNCGTINIKTSKTKKKSTAPPPPPTGTTYNSNIPVRYNSKNALDHHHHHKPNEKRFNYHNNDSSRKLSSNKDELHDIPILSNNPLFVKSKNTDNSNISNYISGLKSSTSNNDNVILSEMQQINNKKLEELSSMNRAEYKSEDDYDEEDVVLPHHRKTVN